MRNNKVEYEVIDLHDVKLTDQEVRVHINFVLYSVIDINLREACKLAFELLEDADVNVDKLEELEFHFTEAKESLYSFNKHQMKDLSKDDPKIDNISKLYPNLN